MNDDLKDPPTPADVSPDAVFKVVAIGASAGGILALKPILSALPSQFDAAIVVVQHRDSTEPGMLAHVLGLSCPFPVQDAEDGEPLRPGVVFLARAFYSRASQVFDIRSNGSGFVSRR